jgi:LysR family glycine cleavage system transcriptional activator
MTTRTPPLPALRSFAALVRLGSITAAADELSLTRGAITHQIRALENFLEIQLVDRNSRSLVLTEQGRIYGYQVRQALDDIAAATVKVGKKRTKSKHEELIRVSVLPSFAQGWLLPRLDKFCQLFPQIRLAFHSSMEYVDINSGVVDCAIRFGHGNWPDTVTRPLMSDTLLLLASPDFLSQQRATDSLDEILKMPILHSIENWSGWMSSMPGGHSDLRRPLTRMEFTDSTHLLEATRLGLGVALTRRSIADNLLSKGELVKAFDHECEHASNYYAILPTTLTVNEPVEQFLAWLQTECSRFMRRTTDRLFS